MRPEPDKEKRDRIATRWGDSSLSEQCDKAGQAEWRLHIPHGCAE
jgi:hypothetical protein